MDYEMSDEMKTPFIEVNRATRHFRVDRSVYRDPEIFQRERDTIFRRCWLYALHDSELARAGDFVRRNVGGEDLLFVRNKEGEVGAFFNACPHRAVPVCFEATGNRKTFTCAYHGWVFDQLGRLRDQSTKSGYAPDFNADGRYNLKPVPRVENYRGWFFVNFNPRAIPLFDYLAGAREMMDLIADQSENGMEVVAGGQEFTCEANWKMMMENQFDSYHGMALHLSYFEFLKGYASNSDATNFNNVAGYTRTMGNGHGVFLTSAVTGRPVAQWITPFGEDGLREIQSIKGRLIELHGQEKADRIAETNRNMVIFPNLVLNDNFSVSARSIYPLAPNRMRVSIWGMGPKGESERFRALRLDNYLSFTGPAGFATPDDIEVFEAAQRTGLHGWSDVSKGMKADDDLLLAESGIMDEAQVRGWWTQWDRVVSGTETFED